MTAANFPILSFHEFLTGSEIEKRAIAQQLYDAFHTYGWVYLKDFGITKEEIAEMFAMVRCSSLLDVYEILGPELMVNHSLRSILSGL